MSNSLDPTSIRVLPARKAGEGVLQYIKKERVSKALDSNVLLTLIWVQTVCKGCQQMTSVAASMKRVYM